MVNEEEVIFLRRIKEQVEGLRWWERLGKVTVEGGKACN